MAEATAQAAPGDVALFTWVEPSYYELCACGNRRTWRVTHRHVDADFCDACQIMVRVLYQERGIICQNQDQQ